MAKVIIPGPRGERNPSFIRRDGRTVGDSELACTGADLRRSTPAKPRDPPGCINPSVVVGNDDKGGSRRIAVHGGRSWLKIESHAQANRSHRYQSQAGPVQ